MPDTKPEQIKVITSPMPVFENELVNELYYHDFRISPDVLNQLLALPEESLAADLKKVLQDGVKRFTYFFDNPDIKEEETNFLLHAILLIAEKNQVELLPDILNILQADDDLLDFYAGDLLTEVIWVALYKLCLENPMPLFDFLKKSNIYTFSKTTANQALAQLYYHNNDLQPLIIAGYKDLTAYLIEHEDDKGLIDTELIADIACTMKDISLPELENEIKLLYGHDLVSFGYAGTYESLTARAQSDWPEEKIPGIIELYHDAVTTWSGYNEDFSDDDFFDDDFEIQEPFLRSEPKIGRNDRCPCGSGKKYKKCCLKDAD